jgi:hypothetical protein
LRYIRILSEPHSQYHASASSNCHSVPLTSPPEIGRANLSVVPGGAESQATKALGRQPAVR